VFVRLAALFMIASIAMGVAAESRTITNEEFERGFAMTRVGTQEVFDFSPPANAVVCYDWESFGAAEDWIYIDLNSWSFRHGTNEVDRLRVFSFAKAESQSKCWFAPFKTRLGIPRQRPFVEGQFWHCITPENTLLLTWREVLFDRSPDKPICVQIEISQSGRFVFRYDLSRLDESDIAKAIIDIGASFGNGEWRLDDIPPDLTSLTFYPVHKGEDCDADPDCDGISTKDEIFVYFTDPTLADSDYDGLNDFEELFDYGTDPLKPYSAGGVVCDGIAVKAGGNDLLSHPDGSTNSVLQHLFYSGTIDGAIEYPKPTGDTAVLKVSAYPYGDGYGHGRLVVGDKVVPLYSDCPGPVDGMKITLLLAVEKGVRKNIWVERAGGLEFEIESDDFAIGELPKRSNQRGWIAFPHTDAVPPCIHDFIANGKGISLAHGEEFPGITATWSSDDEGVSICNIPPVSAEVTANFSRDRSRSISYTIDHPKRLNGSVMSFVQELRFCPKFSHDEMPPVDPRGDPGYDDYYDNERLWQCSCGGINSCICDGKGWCHCSSSNCRCNENKSPCLDDDCSDAAEAFSNIVHGLLLPMPDVLYIHSSNPRTEYLTVPEGSPEKCCLCPEHWATNYVSLASSSKRVAVKDAGGNDFSISHEPCTVTMLGLTPSLKFGDSPVCFITNGVTSKRHDFTVLGLKMIGRSWPVPIERYNSLSPDFGLPIAAVGVDHSLELRTDVKLEGGYVHLALEDVTGDFEVWLPDWQKRYNSTWHDREKLLDGKGIVDRYFSMEEWRGIMRRYHESNTLNLYVRSSSEGRCRLKFEYAASDGRHYVHDVVEQVMSSCDPLLRVDYDRDGIIGTHDIEMLANGRQVYFWVNDDEWKGDDAFETFVLKNAGNKVIDGRNDLINFLPVMVDISPFVSHWSANEVYFRLETYLPDFLKANVAFADIDWSEIGDTHLGEDMDVNGNRIFEAPVTAIGQGLTLPTSFAALSRLGRSTLLIEFAKAVPTDGLYLRIYSKADNACLFSDAIWLHVGDVSDMMGWLNLRSAAGGSDGVPTRLDTPGWPASEHDEGNIVFVHGYNMAEDAEVPLWAKNVFKKLWWSGLNRGFIAVQWRGNEGQVYVPGVGFMTPNYYGNVQNAFATASALSSAMQGVGGPKWFLAHSLGNMLVSAAIQDYDMEYEKYFMLNSAVAMEAYDSYSGITQESHDNMTPGAWKNYSDKVRSTHWFERFPRNDGRRLLTWKERFSKISDVFVDGEKVVNFYSTEEEVVNNGDGNEHTIATRNYVWYNQETLKGLWPMMLHEYEGGWGFNQYYDTVTGSWLGNEYVESRYHMPPNDAETLTDPQLRLKPFFLDFANSGMYSSSNGVIVASNYLYRAEMLAYAIPSESFAVGANPFPRLDNVEDLSIVREGNYDMATLFHDAANEAGLSEDEKKWVHSTFVQRSYRRTKDLYRSIMILIKQGGNR